jgi:hypothetical protein
MITCASLFGRFFIRQGNDAIWLEESEAIALKRHLRSGLIISDGTHQIQLTNEDSSILTEAISILQKQKQKRRRKDRRALGN